jgi:hypothetical protein
MPSADANPDRHRHARPPGTHPAMASTARRKPGSRAARSHRRSHRRWHTRGEPLRTTGSPGTQSSQMPTPCHRTHRPRIDRSQMNTRELDHLSQTWSEQELASALRNFILEVGRLPAAGELTRYVSERASTWRIPTATPHPNKFNDDGAKTHRRNSRPDRHTAQARQDTNRTTREMLDTGAERHIGPPPPGHRRLSRLY